jgi:hypothetical protein
MDKAAADVNEQAQQPQHQQNNNNGPEHGQSFLFELGFLGIYPEDYRSAKVFSEAIQLILPGKQLRAAAL